MEPTTEVIPWYKSKIIWAQVVAALFGLASLLRPDFAEVMGVSQEQVVGAVMTVIAIFTAFKRYGPTPDVVSTQTVAHEVNALRAQPTPASVPQPLGTGDDKIGEEAADSGPTSAGSEFSGQSLFTEATRRTRPATEMKPGGGSKRR
jgi:hypothetical protein